MNDPVDDGRGHDALADFLREMEAYELLTHEQHLDLIARAQAGDRAAMDDMIAHNLRFVVYWAKRRMVAGLSLLDLIQEGSLGLRRAVEKYKLKSGKQFSTYAAFWIKQAIGRFIANNATAVRVPEYVQRDLAKEFRANPTDQARNEARYRLIGPTARMASLDTYLHPHSADETTLADTIPAVASRRRFENPVTEQLLIALIKRAELTEREIIVLFLSYGIYDGREWTQPEIGAVLPRIHTKGRVWGNKPLSKQRVQNIESEALRKLRRAAVTSEDRDALLALVA